MDCRTKTEKPVFQRGRPMKVDKLRMARWIETASYWIVRVLSTAYITATAYYLLAELAYRERGYYAIGGEALLAVAVGAAVWWMIGNQYQTIKGEKNDENSNL